MNKKKTSPFRILWDASYGGRWLYILAMLCMAAAILCNYIGPQIIMFVVDSVLGSEPAGLPAVLQRYVDGMGGAAAFSDKIPQIAVLMLVIMGLGGALNFLRGRLLSVSAEGAIKRLRDRVYAHIQYLPYSWHVRIQTGDIIQRCTSDVEVVRNFIFNQLIEIARTALLVVFAYSILFPMNFAMALASFVFLPVVFAYSYVFLKKVSTRFLQADEAEGKLMSVAQENLTGVRVVRAFGRERHESDRFDTQNKIYSGLWMKLGNLLSVFWGMGDLITGLQMVVLCVVGAVQAAAGNLSVGQFIVFLFYNSMTIWPVRGLGRVLSEASKAGVSLARLGEILDAPLEDNESRDSEHAIAGEIEFRDVSFSYDNQQVLDNVSFTLESGKTLGILGGTGSGKTTLAHLICRLYELSEGGGQILIDGRDIREYDRYWLRKNVGIVLQEPFLYSRTIRENIASLSKLYSIEDIRRAALDSCVDDAIDQFTNGFDTIVGERGVTLSGGQKQRVAIARALISDAPIMIFDDSLSAVDTETDARIRASLAARTSGTTTIIIAHRITSISDADNIIVLDSGKIAEMGTHSQLIERDGIYRRIYEMQESIEEAV